MSDRKYYVNTLFCNIKEYGSFQINNPLYNSPYGVCIHVSDYDHVKALSVLIETSPNWHGR